VQLHGRYFHISTLEQDTKRKYVGGDYVGGLEGSSIDGQFQDLSWEEGEKDEVDQKHIVMFKYVLRCIDSKAVHL